MTNRFPSLILYFFLSCFILPIVAYAAVTLAELQQAGMDADLAQFARAVTVNEGNWTSVNQFGCVGAFQFCPPTFQEMYSGTKEQFLNSPSDQVTTYKKYMRTRWKQAQKNGLTSAVGKSACWKGKCVTITESSIIMATQFGAAKSSKLGHFVQNGFNCEGPYNTSDGNGTSVCKYLVTGANYNVSSITGNDSDAQPTMQCLADLSSINLSLSIPYGADKAGGNSVGNEWSKNNIGLTATQKSSNKATINAGFSGDVSWYPSESSSGSSVVIMSSDKNMRISYGGLDGVSQDVNNLAPQIVKGKQVGLMGEKGFSLSMAVKQDALKKSGLSGRAGATVECPDCNTSSNGVTALSSDKLKDAASRSFYYINPETFLSHQLSISSDALKNYPQAFSGRSGSQTLPTICNVSTDAIARSSPSSGGSGASVDGGTAGQAGYRAGADYAADQAQQAERGLWIELAKTTADELRVKSQEIQSANITDSGFAHLNLVEANH